MILSYPTLGECLSYLTHTTNEENTIFDTFGRYLLTPLTTLFNTRKIIILQNSRANEIACYALPHIRKQYDSNKTFNRVKLRILITKIISFLTLPLSIIGIISKGISLYLSVKNRKILASWKQLYQPPSASSPLSDRLLFAVDNIDNYLVDLYRTAMSKNLLPDLIEKIAENPTDYCFGNYLGGCDNTICLPPFYECGCLGYTFDRLHNTRRHDLEQKLITVAWSRFPPTTTQKISYLSLGAGGMLQDFINLGHLTKMGYQDISIRLVDRAFKSNESLLKVFNTFLDIFTHLSEQKRISISIQGFSSVKQYISINKDETLQLISAVDLEDFYSDTIDDLLSLQKRLDPNGYLSLNLHDKEIIFNLNGIEQHNYLNQKGPWNMETEHCFRNMIEQTGPDINCAICTPSQLLSEGVYLLHFLRDTVYDSLTIITLREWGVNQLSDNDIKNITTLLSMMKPPHIKLQIKITNTLQDILEPQFPKFSSYQLISFDPHNWIGAEQTTVKALRQKFPNSAYYTCCAYEF